ncbi:MAG: SocA family protein [Gammaproteobacteria bacterium]|nr:SocA family protein [Gammaproteobacteria bacterium]
MPTCQFDSEKTVEAIVYIAERLRPQNSTIYTVVKLLYFADRIHLNDFGRLITGDRYVAMRNGPVPSKSYDIVKSVRGDGCSINAAHASSSFNITGKYNLVPLRKADVDLFSDSEIESLDKVIRKDGSKSFGELKRKSHDPAFKEADDNDFMSLESIVRSLPNSESLLKHISDPFPG